MLNLENFKPFDYTINIDYKSLVDILERQEIAYYDYGVTKNEVMNYIDTIFNSNIQDISNQKAIIYQHRCKFFIAIVILFDIYLFFFIVGYFNDFMKEIDLFYNILLYPSYIILGIMIYILHRYIKDVIYSVNNFFQRKFIYSLLGDNAQKIKRLLDDIQKQYHKREKHSNEKIDIKNF